MKRLVEVFTIEQRQILYEIPDDVFEVVENAYEQSRKLNAKTTYFYLVKELPSELRKKIRVMTVNYISPDDQSFIQSADVVKRYYKSDEYEIV